MQERTGGSDQKEQRSVAARALAASRPAIARSFRLHRPRGPFCGRGYCQQCPVRLPDGRGALACLTDEAAAARPPAVDPLRLLGRLGERMPPWFYESRYRRPRSLRQWYLRILRHLSSAPPLPRVAAPLGEPWRELETRTLVVGGGASGTAAAAALAASGRRVLLVEAERELGGSSRFVPPAAARIGELVKALDRGPAKVLLQTICAGLYPGEGIAALVGPEGPSSVRFEELVVATGAYDRPLPYEGNDLPGTIGLRAFETYLAQSAFSKRTRVGVFAPPEEAARALAAAKAHGLSVAWLAGPDALPDSAAPSHPHTTLLRAAGTRRQIRSVWMRDLDPIECDVLVIGFSQPTYELQVQAGCRPSARGRPAVIVASGEPRLPMLVVGEAAGHVALEGLAQEASRATEAWINGGSAEGTAAPRTYQEAVLRSPDAFVCSCEDVRLRDIEAAVAEGFGGGELVKRRTGAGTGACQGKLCLAEVASALEALGVRGEIPTIRPPIRPLSIAALSGAPDG